MMIPITKTTKGKLVVSHRNRPDCYLSPDVDGLSSRLKGPYKAVPQDFNNLNNGNKKSNFKIGKLFRKEFLITIIIESVL